MVPPMYAGRGGSYEWEGQNRSVGMGVLATGRGQPQQHAAGAVTQLRGGRGGRARTP